jgi:hypothetical protein
MKKILLILGIIIILFVVLGIAKDQLIKGAVVIGAKKVIGAPVEIDGFSLGIFKQRVRIKGFRMYNPEGFGEGTLIDIPEISVDYNLGALLKKKLHLPLVVVNLKEVGIVKNKEGALNVGSLKVTQKEEEPSKPQAADKPQETKKQPQASMPMQIDVLTLTIGKVVYKDFSAGEKPSVEVFDVGIKEKTYKDIRSAQQLVALILAESMKGAGIKGAAIYGAATLLGVGFLPAGVAGVLIGEDRAEEVFNVSYERAYKISLEVLRQMGKVTAEDSGRGVIKGVVSGSKATIRVIQEEKAVKITVSARKMLLPKPKTSGGILYEISGKLKGK